MLLPFRIKHEGPCFSVQLPILLLTDFRLISVGFCGYRLAEVVGYQVRRALSSKKRSSAASLFAAVFSNKAKTPNTFSNSTLVESKSLQ